jgi:hypothetical protein
MRSCLPAVRCRSLISARVHTARMRARRKRGRHVRHHKGKDSKLKNSLFRFIFVPDAHRNLD